MELLGDMNESGRLLPGAMPATWQDVGLSHGVMTNAWGTQMRLDTVCFGAIPATWQGVGLSDGKLAVLEGHERI